MKKVGETVEKKEETNRDEEKIKTGKTKKKCKFLCYTKSSVPQLYI